MIFPAEPEDPVGLRLNAVVVPPSAGSFSVSFLASKVVHCRTPRTSAETRPPLAQWSRSTRFITSHFSLGIMTKFRMPQARSRKRERRRLPRTAAAQRPVERSRLSRFLLLFSSCKKACIKVNEKQNTRNAEKTLVSGTNEKKNKKD